MPKPIQQGRLVQGLVRRLGLVGRLPLVLDETVVPVFVVGNLSRGDQGVGPIEAAGGMELPAGGAGNQSVIQLFGDSLGDTVLRLRKITMTTPVGANVEIREGTTVLGAVETPVFFTDFRTTRTPAANMRGLAVAGGLAGNVLFRAVLSTNQPRTVEFENLIVPTGHGVHANIISGNQLFTVSFEWDEVDGNLL